MRAVGAQVFARPYQVVLLAAFGTIGPQIGAPGDPGGAVARQRRVAGDLRGDGPLHGEGAFIGVGLGVERRRGVAAVDAAGKVRDLQVRILVVEVVERGDQVGLKLLRRGRPGGGGQRVGLLDPGDLNLFRRDVRGGEAVLDDIPIIRVRVGGDVRGLGALRAVDEDEVWIYGAILRGEFQEGLRFLGGVRHADGEEDDLPVDGHDGFGQAQAFGEMRLGRRVLTVGIEAAFFSLIGFAGEVGQRDHAGGFARRVLAGVGRVALRAIRLVDARHDALRELAVRGGDLLAAIVAGTDFFEALSVGGRYGLGEKGQAESQGKEKAREGHVEILTRRLGGLRYGREVVAGRPGGVGRGAPPGGAGWAAPIHIAKLIASRIQLFAAYWPGCRSSRSRRRSDWSAGCRK